MPPRAAPRLTPATARGGLRASPRSDLLFGHHHTTGYGVGWKNDDTRSDVKDVTESAAGDQFQVVTLEALVRMKLAAFHDKDRTHLRDLIDVGLIDREWPARLPSELRDRLQLLLDTPEG